MNCALPAGHIRPLLTAAVLALLTVLLLLSPGEVKGQSTNNQPTMTTTQDAYNFAENTDVSTAIATFAASDIDSGDTLTWTISGDDADDFNISSSGEFKFKSSPDFESPMGSPAMMGDPADNSYEVTVEVKDSKDDSGDPDTEVDADLDVVVTVTNVDEAGAVTITGTLEGGEELTASVTDPDGAITSGSLSWQMVEFHHVQRDLYEHQRGNQQQIHLSSRRRRQVSEGHCNLQGS